MAKFIVVNPKTYVDNALVPVGTILTIDEITPSLVGKIEPVAEVEEKQLEVSTPKRRAE